MALNLAALLQGVANNTPPGIDQAPPPPMGWEQMVDPRVLVQREVVTPVAQGNPQYDGPSLGVAGKDPIRNKSAIGIGGTFRDILGYLGDALTGNMNYAKQRRQERFGNILAGKYVDNVEESFAQNPMLAIQRLSEEGFGNEAAELLQQVRTNEIANRRAAAQEARDERTAKTQDILGHQRAINIASAMLSNVRSEPEYMRIKGTVENYLKGAGLSDLAATLPPSYEPSLNRWGIQQYQANRLDDADLTREQRGEIAEMQEGGRNARHAGDLGERRRSNMAREGIAQQNADANTSRANKSKDNRPRQSPVAQAIGIALSAIPPAPRRVGDRITSPDGQRYTSPDGKRWVKTN